MCLKIKRKSVWIDFHDANEAVAIMIGDDGCQVPVPAVVLLAASPPVRSIYALYCCPVNISVHTVCEDVLRAVVEIMKNGQAEMPYELNDDVSKVFNLLEVEAELASEQIGSFIDIIESSDVNTKVKKECLIDMGIQVENNDDETRKLEVCPSIQKKGDRCDETEYIRSLTNHKRIHSRGKLYLESELCERPFECDLCEHKAKTKGNLINHKKIHSKENPFECDLCEYRAKHRSQLKTHS